MYVLAGTEDTGMVSIHYIFMQWCIQVLSGWVGDCGGGGGCARTPLQARPEACNE